MKLRSSVSNEAKTADPHGSFPHDFRGLPSFFGVFWKSSLNESRIGTSTVKMGVEGMATAHFPPDN
jgi:hypothetical protein